MKDWKIEIKRICLLIIILVNNLYLTTSRRPVLGCHRVFYNLDISRPWFDIEGILHPCEKRVRVLACWGLCDSSEIADYKMPYKISVHPVCTYSGWKTRKVRLDHCIGHPDPEVEVFDATGCQCRRCNSEFESCENLSR